MTFHENIRYWIWLQRAVGKGANLERLLEPYGGDVQALCEEDPALRDRRLKAADEKRMRWYEEDPRERGVRGGRSAGASGLQKKRKPKPLAESTLRRMRQVRLEDVDDVLEVCARAGIVPLCPEDDCYPSLLKEIETRPAVLYALGDVSLLRLALPIAMVGARDARLTSLSAASELAGTLSRAGLLVVSGAAIGTDAACHIGALNAGCPTVAVLGTGIGTRYLMQNAELRRVIAGNGCLLSEMEPGEPGSKGSFPLRNRIIAGMSVGTVVVEAAVKSGSLITSRFAEDFDREVFVPLFPGVDPDKPLAGAKNTRGGPWQGTRELLERETGIGITCAGDVLEQYLLSYGIDLADLILSGRVTMEELTRDITDPAGRPLPLLSREQVLRARTRLARAAGRAPHAASGEPGVASPAASVPADAGPAASVPGATPLPGGKPSRFEPSLGACLGPRGELLDLAGGGALNADPGWGPYRTRADADAQVYTAAEFTYRRGDHPHADKSPASRLAETETFSTLALSSEDADRSTPLEPIAQSGPTKPKADLSPEALLILGCFGVGDGSQSATSESSIPLYYEEIANRVDLAPQYLFAALTELQLAGYLDLLADQRYVRLDLRGPADAGPGL